MTVFQRGGAQLGIVELGEVCAAQRADSLDLFELLGGWVTTTTPGPVQRFVATAGHRHAWHAELWARRSPTIPPVDLGARTDEHRGRFADLEGVVAYRIALTDLIAGLDGLALRCDDELDPSTARTIDQVATDLRALAEAADDLPTADYS